MSQPKMHPTLHDKAQLFSNTNGPGSAILLQEPPPSSGRTALRIQGCRTSKQEEYTQFTHCLPPRTSVPVRSEPHGQGRSPHGFAGLAVTERGVRAQPVSTHAPKES